MEWLIVIAGICAAGGFAFAAAHAEAERQEWRRRNREANHLQTKSEKKLRFAK